jgi:ligand-binding sensor domain-containing protein
VSATSAQASNTLAEFTTRNWQREDGLPDNSVKAILQTRDGYLWIGTGRGLARYDGRKFTVFDRANTPEFKSEDINCLAEDEAGTLWIGTTAGCSERPPHFAARRNLEYQDFRAVTKPGGFVGAWGGLFQIANGQLIRSDKVQTAKCGVGVSMKTTRVLWFGTSDSLRRLDPGRGHFIAQFRSASPGMAVHAINRRQRRSLGAVFQRIGIHRLGLSLPGRQWTRWSDPLPLDLRSLSLCPSRARDLWLSSKPGRMDRFRDGRLTGFPITQSRPTPYPQCAYEDREGNLWLGTENVGLYRWQARRIPTFSAQNGLPHDNAWTILETRDGSTWIGTDGG